MKQTHEQQQVMDLIGRQIYAVLDNYICTTRSGKKVTYTVYVGSHKEMIQLKYLTSYMCGIELSHLISVYKGMDRGYQYELLIKLAERVLIETDNETTKLAEKEPVEKCVKCGLNPKAFNPMPNNPNKDLCRDCEIDLMREKLK